jgi:hypothetical protein
VGQESGQLQTAQEDIMRRLTLTAFCFLACTTQLVPPPARSEEAIDPPAAVSQPLRVTQAGQCSRRAGPYVTQTTAWTYWRQAQGSGYAVSEGVFPCHEGWRGYCFNVVLAC